MQAGAISAAQHDIMRDLISIQDPVLLGALQRREHGDDSAFKGAGHVCRKVLNFGFDDRFAQSFSKQDT